MESLRLFPPLGSHHIFTNPTLHFGVRKVEPWGKQTTVCPRGTQVSKLCLSSHPSQVSRMNLAQVPQACFESSHRARAGEEECGKKDFTLENGGGGQEGRIRAGFCWQSGEGGKDLSL